MPYKRKYRRFRRKRTYKRRKAPYKRVAKIAKKAALSVVKKLSDPLYTRTELGGYNTATGQYDVKIQIVPGPNNGILVNNQPVIAQAAAVTDIGLPGVRKDEMVSIIGVSARLRIFVPNQIKSAKFNTYLALDNDNVALPAMFNTPDQYTMLREDPAIRKDLAKLRILKANKIHMKAGNGQGDNFRDVTLWWKPKNTLKLKYSGVLATDFLNRKFVVCLKGSYDNTVGNASFGGVITTYYRDL